MYPDTFLSLPVSKPDQEAQAPGNIAVAREHDLPKSRVGSHSGLYDLLESYV